MATLSALYYTTLPLEEKFYQILIELNNNRDYALARGDEKLLFFLMCFDSNLTLLQIFQSSSDNTEYEKRVREEFGFFPTKRLLTLEKFYNERFPTIENEP